MSQVCQISVTEAAQKHFAGLIEAEQVDGMGLRVFLDKPGAAKAEIGITFCPPEQQKATDQRIDDYAFPVFIAEESIPFLDEAKIDYKTDALGGELSISAPYLKGKKPQDSASLFEQVTYHLNLEVNPHLASHGGMVTLVEITEDGIAVLQFGGGCHGCGMVDVTLKEGIEKTLIEAIPGLTGVRDVTDHATGDNPYY